MESFNEGKKKRRNKELRWIKKDMKKSFSHDSICSVIPYIILILTSNSDRLFALSILYKLSWGSYRPQQGKNLMLTGNRMGVNGFATNPIILNSTENQSGKQQLPLPQVRYWFSLFPSMIRRSTSLFSLILPFISSNFFHS